MARQNIILHVDDRDNNEMTFKIKDDSILTVFIFTGFESNGNNSGWIAKKTPCTCSALTENKKKNNLTQMSNRANYVHIYMETFQFPLAVTLTNSINFFYRFDLRG